MAKFKLSKPRQSKADAKKHKSIDSNIDSNTISGKERSLANLTKKGYLATNPVEFGRRSGEVKRQQASIRAAFNNLLDQGRVTFKPDMDKVTVYGEDGQEIKTGIREIIVEVPGYIAAAMKLQEMVMKGDVKALKLAVDLNEDYRNRELALKDKEVKNQEALINHMREIEFKKPIEEGEVIDYEETKREIE